MHGDHAWAVRLGTSGTNKTQVVWHGRDPVRCTLLSTWDTGRGRQKAQSCKSSVGHAIAQSGARCLARHGHGAARARPTVRCCSEGQGARKRPVRCAPSHLFSRRRGILLRRGELLGHPLASGVIRQNTVATTSAVVQCKGTK